MLDLDYIREHPARVEEQSKQKGYPIDIRAFLQLDEQLRTSRSSVEELRRRRNEHAERIKRVQGKPDPAAIEEGRTIKAQLAEIEPALAKLEDEFLAVYKKIPNTPAPHVPVGASEEENQVIKVVGTPPTFTFTPKSHWQIGESRGLIDKERAAKVAGARFAYLKGGLVSLQFAIMQWVTRTLGDAAVIKSLIQQEGLQISEKPFVPVLPPAMVKTEVFDAMDRLEPREERYQVGDEKDNLWLQGSAEHTLGSMYYQEVIPAADLPIRYIGFSSSFRREAGSYSKDLEGIIRLHQFDKLEMEVFSDAATGMEEHKLLSAIQQYLVKELKIHHRVLQKCTGDIGKPNACGMDVDCWMPGQGKFRETHTADYMADYQARRMQTRYRDKSGQLQFVHTNDATAFALGRIIVAIMENYQQEDGTIKVPDVLVPYMGGVTVI